MQYYYHTSMCQACATYGFHCTRNHWSGFPDATVEIRPYLLSIVQYPRDVEIELSKRYRCSRNQINYLASAYVFPLSRQRSVHQYSDIQLEDISYLPVERIVVSSTLGFPPSVLAAECDVDDPPVDINMQPVAPGKLLFQMQ